MTQHLYRRYAYTLVKCTLVKDNKDGTIQIIPSGWTNETPSQITISTPPTTTKLKPNQTAETRHGIN